MFDGDNLILPKGFLKILSKNRHYVHLSHDCSYIDDFIPIGGGTYPCILIHIFCLGINLTITEPESDMSSLVLKNEKDDVIYITRLKSISN